MARRRDTLRRDCRGATALEFALIAPLLFALLFGGIEAGRLLFLSAALQHAVGASARCAAIDPGQCSSPPGIARSIERAMASLAAPLPIVPDAIQLTPAPCGLLIEASLPYPPLLMPASALPFQMRALACAPTAR